jgi:hypothetical protein
MPNKYLTEGDIMAMLELKPWGEMYGESLALRDRSKNSIGVDGVLRWKFNPRRSGRTMKTKVQALSVISGGEPVMLSGHTPEYSAMLTKDIKRLAVRCGLDHSLVKTAREMHLMHDCWSLDVGPEVQVFIDHHVSHAVWEEFDQWSHANIYNAFKLPAEYIENGFDRRRHL